MNLPLEPGLLNDNLVMHAFEDDALDYTGQLSLNCRHNLNVLGTNNNVNQLAGRKALVDTGKLLTGELVIGKYDAENDKLTDVAAIQTIPAQQGVQMVMMPYGYPFEPNFTGQIEGKFFLYRYADTPKELQDKYIEACTNLTVAGGLGKLQFGSGPMPGSGSGLIS